MHDDVIAHIRERVATMRKISGMAHDPRMIEMLDGMIEQAEADIRRLEAESADAVRQLPAQPAGPGPRPQS
jgi:predicted  nucleic acid-binding Zn-ribbon protein